MSKKTTKQHRVENPELSAHVVGAHNIDEVISRITKRPVAPRFIIIDLFCGAGGTSKGFQMTGDIALVAACVNHDFNAIVSHWLNNEEVAHFEEDIRTLDLTPLIRLIDHYKQLYPDSLLILWASLECTNYSKAKGGLPRDPDSRTLPISLYRYIAALRPDYVMIENVVEFMAWGPMRIKYRKVHKTQDATGYPRCDLWTMKDEKTGEQVYGWEPISKRNGQEWMRWKQTIDSMGYYHDWRELNAADFGAYTSRNRLFGIFARPHLPLAWPEPTHAKQPNASYGFLSPLQKWKPVKEVLDFSDEGQSIFNRQFNENLRKQDRHDLVENTLARIYAGLLKFVAGLNEKEFSAMQNKFLVQRNSGEPKSKVVDVNGPARTLTASAGNQDLIQASFLINYNHSSNTSSTTHPCPSIVAADKLALGHINYLTLHYSNGGELSSVNAACPTLSTKDRVTTVTVKHFIKRDFSEGGGQVSSVDIPAGGLTCVPKMHLMRVERFISDTSYNNVGSSVEETFNTILANRKHHYLINPQYGNGASTIDQPCFTLIARMDKRPPSIITPLFLQTEAGELGVIIYEEDSPYTKKIKEFMALYGIVDIKMRMLKVSELLVIQGFPSSYKLVGSQADRKKFIGNSVVPHVVKAWAEALAGRLEEFTNQKVA